MGLFLRKTWLLFFLFMTIVNFATAQEISISGVVSSEGIPLPGVTIVLKGTTNGTITDLDGNYTINVPDENAVLVFSYVGFLSQEVTVGSQTRIDVSLVEDVKTLSEVVVIGYGIQKKSDISGAISSVSSEELTQRPVASLDMALQGKASGVQIAPTSGMPGAGAKIRIRGIGSLGTSNDPLWVIDGYVGGDMNSVAPDDIESIEILKDASSTAIYGARGGNGVIIVTTKKGKQDKSTVNFSHYTQLKSVINKMDVLSASDYMRLRNQGIINDGGIALYSEEEINLTAPVSSTGYIADTDWQDEVFENALSSFYSLGVNGGSENGTYAFSVNHRKDDGIIQNSNYRRTGVNISFTQKLNDMFDFGVNAKGYMSKQEGFDVNAGAGWAWGPVGGAVYSLPIYPVRDSDDKYFYTSTWDNPLKATEKQIKNNSYNLIQGNFYLNFKPFEGLTITATISGEARLSKYESFVSAELYEATQAELMAKASIAEGNYYKWLGNIVATYNKTYGEKHDLSFMLGVEQQAINSNSLSINTKDVNKENLLWYDLSAYNTDYHQPRSDYWESVYRSQFSRFTYNLMNKYLFMATVRRDGSSVFGPGRQHGVFPSLSGAWKMHHENFIKNLDIFSQLKLRLSWGQSGNDQIGVYKWLPLMGYNMAHTNAVFGDNLSNGAVITTIPNETISWETSSTVNLGIDMSFVENRLNLIFDIYDKTTTDLLWPKLLPLYAGYGTGWNPQDPYFPASIWTNYAKMNNKGIELGLDAVIVDNNEWDFNLGVNFALNRNKVIDLGDEQEFFTGVTKVEIGKPIGNIYGFVTDGLYTLEDEANGEIPIGKYAGDQKYKDINNDGSITDNDMDIIGNALPDFTGGLNASLSYKSLSFNMNWNLWYGNDMFNGTYQTLANGSLLKTNGGDFLKDAWTRDKTNTDVPRLSQGFSSKISDRYVQDASFLKLTNAIIAYNLPARLISKAKIQSAKVYVSGQNLLMFTNYTGFDPELSPASSSDIGNLNIGYDNKNYPSARAFTIGVNISF